MEFLTSYAQLSAILIATLATIATIVTARN